MVSVQQMAHKNQTEKMSTHPLEPLNGEEIAAAVASVKAQAGLDESAWFETISLDEPGKDELADETSKRRAYVCCYEPSSNRTFNGVVDLSDGKLLRWDHIEGAQARIVPDEFSMVHNLV